MNLDPKTFYNERMPNKLGKDYEHARWHSNAFQEAQYRMMIDVMRRLAVSVVKDAKTVLEIGPGAATWTKFLLEANMQAHYTLVDISAEMLSRAKAAIPSSARVSFVEADLLTYEPGTRFDVIFSSRAVEYVSNKNSIAAKLTSLLAPDGTLVIITKMPKKFFNTLAGRRLSELHAGQVSPGMFTTLLKKSGLTISMVRMATATVPVFKSPLLNQVAFQLFSRLPLIWPLSVFAESYIVIAKNPL